MYVYSNEEKINQNTVRDKSSTYKSVDGNIYCEGCVIEPYNDEVSGNIWFKKSKRYVNEPLAVYKLKNNRFHRVPKEEAEKIPDWIHRYIKNRLQNF